MKVNLTALENWLQRSSDRVMIAYCGSAAFCTYVCMYAFRKPFTAATFEGVDGWEFSVDFKTALLISQVVGYAMSKFIGIKVISEITPGRRTLALLGLVVVAWLALLLLPLLPPQWAWLALLCNGLPLGMVWGLVFSFLEGRRITEAVGAILCASFIFGSGIVKSVGRWLLIEQGVGELWMPALTGLIFLPPLLLFTFLLSRTPPPNARDVAARKARGPINKEQRRAFARRYWPGLFALVLAYVLLTVVRDFTDNFAAELWIALGYGDTPEIFAITSLPVSILVLAVMFSLMYIRDNNLALLVNHAIIALGFAICLVATCLYQLGGLGGAAWLVLINLGLYISYVPFNCIIFDRLVASVRGVANAGFLIYLADAFGYLGSVNVLLYRSLAHGDLPWVEFVSSASYIVGLVGVILTAGSALYFSGRIARERNSLVQGITI